MGPWPGGGAEGIGVDGRLNCGEAPIPCEPKWLSLPPWIPNDWFTRWLAAGARGRGPSGSCDVPAAKLIEASGEGNLAPSAFGR